MHEDVAVSALQRRTGDHSMFACLAEPVDLVGDRLQPGPAIFVGEGMAGAHLGDVAGGMKLVAILIAPAQPFGELVGDGALARAGYAHHHQRAGHLAFVIGHENSPEARPHRPARWSRQANAPASRAGFRHPARGSKSRAWPNRWPRTAFRDRSRAPARSA